MPAQGSACVQQRPALTKRAERYILLSQAEHGEAQYAFLHLATAPPGMKLSLTAPPFIRKHLGPTDILCEVLFGLIMVLTFTLGAGLVVEEGPQATRRLLIGIIGCNLAWGLIDGLMHILSSMLERSRKSRLIKALQTASDALESRQRIAEHLDPLLAPYTLPAERERLYAATLTRLKNSTPPLIRLSKDDVLGGLAKFWLVVISTIPATLPFVLLDDRTLALRLSNGLLLAMLFLVGYRWAQDTNSPPWRVGTTLLLGGLFLVGVAIALGG